MEDLIEAIKSNDLVAVKKSAYPLISERINSLIEQRKVEIARSIMIEGEEAPDEEEDEKEEEENDESKEEDEKEEDE